jgi:hypothetical protein
MSISVQLLNPLPIADPAIFSTLQDFLSQAIPAIDLPQTSARCAFQSSRVTACTISGHLLVGSMHSIEIQAHRVARFLLTLKIEGVKT